MVVSLHQLFEIVRAGLGFPLLTKKVLILVDSANAVYQDEREGDVKGT